MLVRLWRFLWGLTGVYHHAVSSICFCKCISWATVVWTDWLAHLVDQLAQEYLCSQHLMKVWQGEAWAQTQFRTHTISYAFTKLPLNIDYAEDFHASTERNEIRSTLSIYGENEKKKRGLYANAEPLYLFSRKETKT